MLPAAGVRRSRRLLDKAQQSSENTALDKKPKASKATSIVKPSKVSKAESTVKPSKASKATSNVKQPQVSKAEHTVKPSKSKASKAESTVKQSKASKAGGTVKPPKASKAESTVKQPKASKAGGTAKPPKASKAAASKRARPVARSERTKANARRERAKTQRLFLVDRRDSSEQEDATYAVMGTTGNIYYVTLNRTPKCSCIDQRTRKRNCKHILFVYIRVLKLDESDTVVIRSQSSLSEAELKRVRALTSAQVAEQVVAAPAVLSAYEASTGQRVHINSTEPMQPEVNRREIEEGDECAICYEQLIVNEEGKSEELKFCTQKCGRAVHLECFEKWASQKRKAGVPVNCVYCRAVFADAADAADDNAPLKRRRINLEAFV